MYTYIQDSDEEEKKAILADENIQQLEDAEKVREIHRLRNDCIALCIYRINCLCWIHSLDVLFLMIFYSMLSQSVHLILLSPATSNIYPSFVNYNSFINYLQPSY